MTVTYVCLTRDECIDKIRNISKLPTRKIKLPKANGNIRGVYLRFHRSARHIALRGTSLCEAHRSARHIALRGKQAGREYYMVIRPLKLIPKIFLFDEEQLPPELRAQRRINMRDIYGYNRYRTRNR